MRRFGKLLAFSLACSLALVLTVQHGHRGMQVAASNPLRAAGRGEARHYDLSRLPIFSKTQYLLKDNYFDKSRFDHRKMLVGALDFIQRDVPEILIDRFPEKDPRQVTVKVNGQQHIFSIEGVDAPWTLTTKLAEIFRFIQPNLQPVPEKEEARRLVEIEMAATNGMLYTLDPHSTLLDVESYRDMRTSTQGKFGGLGIVIGMEKGRITVRRPMPDSPAARVGIKAKDRIVRIDNESTVNMTLTEAVERLRGDEDTTVDVYIERDNVPGQKKLTITRAEIRPPSIDPPARVLNVPAAPGQPAAKVGYFRMASFTANSTTDLAAALQMFERERVRGIVMDLRGNPGGLLDQAQKVADAFIEAGTLVSTVGIGGSQREDKVASKSDREPKVPVAVLVNQYSASASEIVAGALKNLDRGVVIGESTFGKGSVQVLFDINSPVPFGERADDDKLGLKLTIAQYLTPGDISIQSVGVTPDVEVVPMLVQKDDERSWIRLQASGHRRREADLEQRLESPHAKQEKGSPPPSETVSYLFVPKPSETKAEDPAEGEEGPVEPEEQPAVDEDADFRADFLIEMARDLVAQAKSSRRRELLNGSKAFFDKVRADEDAKLTQALQKLGVDWTPSPAGPQAALAVTLQPVGDGRVEAGGVARIRGTVRNVGPVSAHRVRATLESDNPLFDENEMVFGKILPGESRTYDIPVKVPLSTWTRTDVIRAAVHAQRGAKASSSEMTLHIEGKPRPLFAYTYQTIDDVRGNKDGQVQRGEQVRTLVTVKNIGVGRALKTEAVLRNGPGQPGILISAGRFEGKELAPGETKTFSFVYEVRPEYRGDDLQLDLTVGDTTLGESVHDRIKVRVATAAGVPEPASGTVTVARGDAVLREAPVEGALIVGHAPKGTAFKVTGKLGAFTRVELENGRPAFLAAAEVQPGGSPRGAFRPEWQVTPPVITLNAPTVATGETLRLTGQVNDDREVRDVFVKVWNRSSKLPVKKVFYKPNRAVGSGRARLDFEADIPLWNGNNHIQVFARESNEVQSVQTLVVLKRTPESVLARPADQTLPPPPGVPGVPQPKRYR